MARNPVSRRIVPTDSDYQDVWEAWDENGRVRQFDRMGEWGGAIYRCYDLGSEEPDFYQAASLQGTFYSDDGPAEYPYQVGWWHVNRNYMRLRARWRPDGRIIIERPEIPNEL